MRAVIIATGESTGFRFLRDRYPSGLLPVAGKPFLFHVVEKIVQAGVLDFDFVLSHLPAAVESALGDGSRWGARFRYHLTPDAVHPYRALKAIVESDRASFLLGREDCLPEINDVPSANVVWCDQAGSWTGWAVLSNAGRTGLPSAEDADGFAQAVVRRAKRRGDVAKVERVLSIATPQAYLDSQAVLLAGHGPSNLLLSGNEASPGVRISRNVSLHPTAKIEGPAFIGANCRIGAGVRLGPNASIAENCVVDARARIANSAVFPGSYIGEALDLDHVLVDHNRLVNVRLETEVTLTDAFLLGRLSETGLRRWLTRLGRRAAALALLALTWPVLVIAMLVLKLSRKGPVVYYHEAVELPAEGHPEQWKTFQLPSLRPFVPRRAVSLLLDVLPGLAMVACGKLALVGVAPRSRDEVLGLAPDWRNLYVRSKPGLITEASVTLPVPTDSDAIFAAEAYYTAVGGLTHDLRLLCLFVGHSVAGMPEKSMEAPVE